MWNKYTCGSVCMGEYEGKYVCGISMHVEKEESMKAGMYVEE